MRVRVRVCVCVCVCVFGRFQQSFSHYTTVAAFSLDAIALVFLVLLTLMHRAADTRQEYITKSYYHDTGQTSPDYILLMLSI